MAKKSQQSSGPSYSLLALLKRTLFLHETSKLDELVEEVHEYMLKNVTYEQIKERYVGPILQSNPSFREVERGSNLWKLTEGNKVNDSVYEVFLKYRAPLSQRQILNRLAKVEHMAGNIDMSLDLKNDARFSDIEGGKYWILSEWVVINEYARSVLLKVRSGLTERELINRVVGEYGIDKDSAIFIPKLDERFVKKDKKWILRQFAEQKMKLRPSQIDRLYQYLQKIETALNANELTASALNMPAGSTDVNEKLEKDPRFVFEDDKWDLHARVERRRAAALELEALSEKEHPGISEEIEQLPDVEAEEVAAEHIEAPQVQEESVEEPVVEQELPVQEVLESEPTSDEEEVQVAEEKEVPSDSEEFIQKEFVRLEVEEEIAEEKEKEKVVEEGEVIQKEEDVIEAAAEEVIEEEIVGEEAEEADQMDEYIENLRSKVVDFLQDAFHTEGVVYNAEIIDQFVNSGEKEELVSQFISEHFVNPARGRFLTSEDLVRFLVYLAEPSLNDKILDPCCGTGEFLVQILETLDDHLQDAEWTERDFAIQYELRTGQFYFVQMNEEEQEYFDIPLDDAVVRWLPIIRFCKQQQLTGVESDRFAYRTADLNIAVQGFPEIVLRHDDALTSKQFGSGVYDIVLGNPSAFGDNPTRFLRRSLTFAKPGGKILLLLPDDMFCDYRLVSSTLRNQIVAQTIVKAVIHFPEHGSSEIYGAKRTLLYCLKKHRDAEQESDVFVGDVTNIDELRDMLELLDDPFSPVCESDTPISGGVVNYILSSFHGTAYNLFIEGLRRGILRGDVVKIKDWTHVKKASKAHE